MDNLKPKRLKIVQKGYEGYSGPIGPYEFKDGVSVEYIPLNQRDRLAAAFQMVEIEDDGTEVPAGAPARLLRERAREAEAAKPMPRMTEAEKRADDIRVLLGGVKPRPTYTRAALEEVAEKDGIAGLRAVAEPWGVRSKSIPGLIDLILKAQDEYVEATVADLIAKGVPEQEARELFVPSMAANEKPAEPAGPDAGDKRAAAASGDMAAAIND